MEDPGQKLKKRREELKLTYRDVEDASEQIAARRSSGEFAMALSRLADIENKGLVPTIYRLYSLCTIYRLDIMEVLEWYGVDVSQSPGDAANLEITRTHLLKFQSNGSGEIALPISLDPGIDLKKTTYLSRMIQRWGKLPVMLLNGLDLRNRRYAYIGTEDWSMHPLIQPGSMIMIDETKRKILPGAWTSEFDRPIFFLEHRNGYACGWCSIVGGQLILQPHPASHCDPEIYLFPQEIDVVGQVVGVAMTLDPVKRRRPRP